MALIKLTTPLPPGSRPPTKYTVRIKTSKTLSEPYAGVNMCISDADGNFVMKRFQSEPRLFVRGNVDVFHFDAPDIPNVEHVMIAHETGGWGVDEVELVTAGIPVGRFIWTGSPALQKYINPYEGMTKEEIRSMLNYEYQQLKDEIRSSVMQLSAIGTVSTAIALGAQQATAFAIGCGLAATYAYLLENDMDSISTPRKCVGMTTRMIILFASAAAAINHWEHEIHSDNSLFLLGLLGFMVFKASLVRLIK